MYNVHKVIHRIGNRWILSKSFLIILIKVRIYRKETVFSVFLSNSYRVNILILPPLNVYFESEDKIGYDVNGMIGTKLMRCNEIAKAFFA